MSGGSVVCKGWQVGPPTQQFLFSERHIEKKLKMSSTRELISTFVNKKMRATLILECTKGKQEHGEMNHFLMTKTTREMRVVPS